MAGIVSEAGIQIKENPDLRGHAKPRCRHHAATDGFMNNWDSRETEGGLQTSSRARLFPERLATRPTGVPDG